MKVNKSLAKRSPETAVPASMKPALVSIAIAMLIIASSSTLLGRIEQQKPTLSRVAGVYVGYCQNFFWRLELDTNGTGYLCTFFTEPRLYRVGSWRLSEYTVEFTAHSTDPGQETIATKVRYTGSSLERTLGGLTVKLFPERDWQSQAFQTQERIAKYRKASLASAQRESRNSANTR
jgi:hypothetical protein